MILKNKRSLETSNRKQAMELRPQSWKLIPLDCPWQVKSSRLASVSQWPSTPGVHTIHVEKFIMGEVDPIYLISRTKQQRCKGKRNMFPFPYNF